MITSEINFKIKILIFKFLRKFLETLNYLRYCRKSGRCR